MDSGHEKLKNFALALSKKVNKGAEVMDTQLDDTIGMDKKKDLSDTLFGVGDLLEVSFCFSKVTSLQTHNILKQFSIALSLK